MKHSNQKVKIVKTGYRNQDPIVYKRNTLESEVQIGQM